MKAKKLITEDDLVLNPKGYFGNKIPCYPRCEGKYAREHGSINYGAFRAVVLANSKAAEVLDAIVTFVYGYNEKEREFALEKIKSLAEQYKQED